MPLGRGRPLAAFVFGAVLLCAHATFAQGDDGMTEGSQVAPPAGFISFCMREPAQCASDGASGVLLPLDAKTRALLEDVNGRVNERSEWVEDVVAHGRREYFAIISGGKGDCDDIVVTKRAMLHRAGIPLHDLRIAIAVTPKGEKHAVLVVTTAKGDLVLDSRDPKIRPWRDANYRWVKRQDGSAMGWADIPEGMAGNRTSDRRNRARGSHAARPR